MNTSSYVYQDITGERVSMMIMNEANDTMMLRERQYGEESIISALAAAAVDVSSP